ncbi:uroporphyrinogen III methyltransferase / synthase [Prosthecobacter debontii]|uniref:uroporphyrinogen-III C-methyltransferase n=1 Tax=Prosthecobacter debontii TaxID=48467 RepID=A0A1T4XW78_9BACT|nr:uroporphyrinogen-III C-methyltransferase [Prosthecobacter debontii]SKA93311.1 uroporphyrinogen III methyltransferase / synthase [Prosthecobacter debontii]
MSKSSAPSSPGICYLVGAGPGDPGLLTLKGKECIEAADVLVYDYLCNPELLRHAKPGTEKIYVGKKAKDHTLTQDKINELIVKLTREGKVVTRLKGGDPVLFGRGAEEATELAEAGVAFEIVPGITSAIAGPAYAGIPVTHRDHCSQLTIFTGHEDPTKEETSLDYAKLAKADGTKVFLMGVERMGEITGKFIENGASPDTPMALVRWATHGRQQTLIATLGTMAERVKETGFKAPAVAVVGDVVTERKNINWFESRPLFGKRIVVTRTRQQVGGLSKQLRQLGADVIELPTIRIEEPQNLMAFGELVQDCHNYEWIVFTSPNGVDAFFKMFYKLYKDIRSIGGARIAVIGPGTAEKVKEQHLAVDMMPEKNFVAEGLVAALKDYQSLENVSVLWVRGEETREVIANELTGLGAIVDEAIAYRTVPEKDDNLEAIARLVNEGADLITFTSASTVDCFMDLKVALPEGIQIASIGPITSDAVRKHGLKVDLEAETSTIPGLVEAVQKALA